MIDDERVIGALDVVRAEQFGEVAVRGVGLGDDDGAAGVLVDPVHDARAQGVSCLGELIPHMMEQRVDERAIRMSE